MKRGGFFFKQGADDLDVALAGGKHRTARQVQGRVLVVIARDCFQAALAQPEHDAANARPIDCAGAHGARLRRVYSVLPARTLLSNCFDAWVASSRSACAVISRSGRYPFSVSISTSPATLTRMAPNGWLPRVRARRATSKERRRRVS